MSEHVMMSVSKVTSIRVNKAYVYANHRHFMDILKTSYEDGKIVSAVKEEEKPTCNCSHGHILKAEKNEKPEDLVGGVLITLNDRCTIGLRISKSEESPTIQIRHYICEKPGIYFIIEE